MTKITDSPLTQVQEARAAAITLAANAICYDRPLDDLFDVADYIVNGDECPFAALKEPASVSFDLTPVSDDALRILFGVKPAEPEVITVGGVEAFASLPVGSAVLYPGFGGRYVKVGPDNWRRIGGRDGLMGETACKDQHMASGVGVIAEYIPGGV